MLVEIFQSQPKWWADQSTDTAFHRATLLASLKIKLNISGNTICWGRLCETIESSRTATERALWWHRFCSHRQGWEAGKYCETNYHTTGFHKICCQPSPSIHTMVCPLTVHVFHYCQRHKHVRETWGSVPSAQKHQSKKPQGMDLLSK